MGAHAEAAMLRLRTKQPPGRQRFLAQANVLLCRKDEQDRVAVGERERPYPGNGLLLDHPPHVKGAARREDAEAVWEEATARGRKLDAANGEALLANAPPAPVLNAAPEAEQQATVAGCGAAAHGGRLSFSGHEGCSDEEPLFRSSESARLALGGDNRCLHLWISQEAEDAASAETARC